MINRATWAIIRKDLIVVMRTKAVAVPMLLVPILLLLVLPVILTVLAGFASDPSIQAEMDIQRMMKSMPGPAAAAIAGMSVEQQFAYVGLVYLMAPLFLLIPSVVAVVVAADSFAGEKERKTLEALLYTPLTDRHLFVAKVLSACMPAFLVGIGSFVIYTIVVNAAAWPIMGRIFFPNGMWIVLVFWLAPAVAVLSLGGTVLVSAHVGTYQAAYQLGSLVVLPILFLIIGQVQGLLFFDTPAVFLIGLIFWALGVTLVLIGARSFRRTNIATRM